MAKVGIVTFYDSYSLGACLQACASRDFFQELGFHAEFVGYKNAYEQGGKSLLRTGDGSFTGALKSFAKSVIFRGSSCMKQAYEGESRLYGLPERSVSTVEEIDSRKYDVLISGSDQIWNPQITNGIDRAYYLDFGEPKKRVALASSAGSHEFSADELTQIVPMLNKFDLIAVRESYLLELLKRNVDARVMLSPDPTLLFDSEYWLNKSKKGKCRDWGQFSNEPYLLTYFVGKGFHEYHSFIKRYTDRLNMPVMNIQFNRWNRNGVDKTIFAASPIDFISLVEHASMVITDSFHGVAFSINLHVPFVAIENSRNPARVRELLRNCKLRSRIEPDPSVILEEVSFDAADEYLTANRIDVRKAFSEVLSEV